MEAFDKALEKVVKALAYLASAFIPCIFTMIVIDVSIRTMGITPPLFTSSIVEYGLLYIAMFSAPWLVREKGHVAIEALVSILRPTVQTVLAKFMYTICGLAALLFSYFALRLFLEAADSGQLDVRGVDMPYWAQFLPMTIGFFLVALEFMMFLAGLRHYYSYDLSEIKDEV
ncbi:MAG: TRAP transporter small permease [Pseudomonadota bacterium]|nr:TRAP transporter small permease [Pseudomonadota bacterium]